VVALQTSMYGSGGYCGKTITITNTGAFLSRFPLRIDSLLTISLYRYWSFYHCYCYGYVSFVLF
jgi:hypothetical protein